MNNWRSPRSQIEGSITLVTRSVTDQPALTLDSYSRPALERLRSGEIDDAFPASALWMHRDVSVLLSSRG